MSANTETTRADRTGCKAPEWCGINTSEKDDDSAEEKARTRAYLSPANRNYGERGKDRKLYCSLACRDARLPPIAAPAVHVERRKGQRWRCTYSDLGFREGTLAVRNGLGWACDGDGLGFSDACWGGIYGVAMTLLADAPPEPATFGSPAFLDAVIKSAPPAQEAPKAARVCMWHERHKCNPPIRDRVLKGGPTALCDWAMHQAEKRASSRTGATGKPYAGPTRLPKPQLAADWVEDCLGDVR